MIVIDDDEADSINDARWCDREEYIKQLTEALNKLVRLHDFCTKTTPSELMKENYNILDEWAIAWAKADYILKRPRL